MSVWFSVASSALCPCTAATVAWAVGTPLTVLVVLGLIAYLTWFKRGWLEAVVLGEMTPRRFSSLKVKGKVLFVMEQILIGVPAQLPAVALPTSYLGYLEFWSFLDFNADTPAVRGPRRVGAADNHILSMVSD